MVATHNDDYRRATFRAATQGVPTRVRLSQLAQLVRRAKESAGDLPDFLRDREPILVTLMEALALAESLADEAAGRNYIEVKGESVFARYALRYEWLRAHSYVEEEDNVIHFGGGCNQHKPEILDKALDSLMPLPQALPDGDGYGAQRPGPQWAEDLANELERRKPSEQRLTPAVAEGLVNDLRAVAQESKAYGYDKYSKQFVIAANAIEKLQSIRADPQPLAAESEGTEAIDADAEHIPREATEAMLRAAYQACDDFIDAHGDGEASNLDDGQWNDMMGLAWRRMYGAVNRRDAECEFAQEATPKAWLVEWPERRGDVDFIPNLGEQWVAAATDRARQGAKVTPLYARATA